MKVFLSHAHNDSFLAKKIASALENEGLIVWNSETEILPGDNFAEKTSEALKEADAMVVLMTPKSVSSPNIAWEVGFALGEKSFDKRVVTVLVDSEDISPENIPWILHKLKLIRLSKSEQTEEGINQVAEAVKIALNP